MKYFTQLDALDTQICRLGELNKLYRVICNGTDTSNTEELRSAIHYIEGSLGDIAESLHDNFQMLFDTLANEIEDETANGLSD